MPAKRRMSATEQRHRLTKWMVHPQMRIKYPDQATSKTALDPLFHLSGINRQRATRKDSMRSLKVAWSTPKETARWETTPITRTHHMPNKVRCTSNVSTKRHFCIGGLTVDK